MSRVKQALAVTHWVFIWSLLLISGTGLGFWIAMGLTSYHLQSNDIDDTHYLNFWWKLKMWLYKAFSKTAPQINSVHIRYHIHVPPHYYHFKVFATDSRVTMQECIRFEKCNNIHMCYLAKSLATKAPWTITSDITPFFLAELLFIWKLLAIAVHIHSGQYCSN